MTYIVDPSGFQDVDGKRYLYFTFTYSDGQTKFGRVQLASGGVDWWPMFRHDLNHTGTSTSTGPTTNNTLWTYPTGGYVYSSPAVVGGLVYMGSYTYPYYSGNVYCLNAASGAFVWSYSAGDSFSSPTIAGGLVYVGSTDGYFYCLNATNGSLVWSYTTGGMWWGLLLLLLVVWSTWM